MIREAHQVIESAIKENDSHIQRLARTKRLLSAFFPLSIEKMQTLTEEQIEHIDQFIYRFTKLQDSMATRLLPAIYSWLESESRPVPFLDILNRLEQLGLIEDVDQWQFFRNLRNNLAHDYPESLEQTVDTLNVLFEKIDILESMYLHMKDFWLKRAKME
ncbi:MAG: hypothetical protein K9K79_01660 [Desulfohalobiaceae bacterium]|nr:hypothetical protein [Desulfohalobiaceae bacterium]